MVAGTQHPAQSCPRTLRSEPARSARRRRAAGSGSSALPSSNIRNSMIMLPQKYSSGNWDGLGCARPRLKIMGRSKSQGRRPKQRPRLAPRQWIGTGSSCSSSSSNNTLMPCSSSSPLPRPRHARSGAFVYGAAGCRPLQSGETFPILTPRKSCPLMLAKRVGP
jgi:hypothetical protein